MTRIIAAILAAVLHLPLTGAIAAADGKVMVPLPNLQGISEQDAEKLIAALAQVNVIASNCPEYHITDGEWTLLVGTGDMLAKGLGMDPDTYDETYYGPAFRMLDDPGACDRIGPRARPIIDDLIKMGGGTEPIPE
ncbi:MAG TPA: hypothetical protein PKC09_15400 [Paracoccus sp. (in: a-proteobacteria)]|uniref:hypothetical protein n=1 Tax=uncultured Paracoccus sp. TaxID=189685 RepID=UPI002633D465|nr:hypothetical protein [uncultured Paracoccus sp.]HMQ42647.1 hypothetical protein [Paracoccus sp. (in: a-proteobacteria)]HMR37600.1 hypothetical protein [Paracoccus sp. (in: a-proteobacteria)]